MMGCQRVIKLLSRGSSLLNKSFQNHQIRRTNRESRLIIQVSSFRVCVITDEGEPENFQEVQTHADKVSWMKAMQEEMHSLLKNDTYELVELPKGRNALRNKWVFKLKKDSDGKLLKYKARLVVKGLGRKRVLTLMRYSLQL